MNMIADGFVRLIFNIKKHTRSLYGVDKQCAEDMDFGLNFT